MLALAAKASRYGYEAMKAGRFPVFLGGDHSLSMGSVAGIARACAEARRPVHLLWLDAHADFNTPRTSPSGNMHGMSVAMLCGEKDFEDMAGHGCTPSIRTMSQSSALARSTSRNANCWRRAEWR